MSIHSCAIDCILHFFPYNLADTGIQFYQFSISTGMEALHIQSYLVCSMLMESLKNIQHSVNVELLTNDLNLSDDN